MAQYLIVLKSASSGTFRQATKSTKWRSLGLPNYVNEDGRSNAIERATGFIERYQADGGEMPALLFELKPMISCIYNASGTVLPDNWAKWVKNAAEILGLSSGKLPPNQTKPASAAEAAQELRAIVRRLIAYGSPKPKAVAPFKPTYKAHSESYKHHRQAIREKQADLSAEIPRRRAAATTERASALNVAVHGYHLYVSELLLRIRDLEDLLKFQQSTSSPPPTPTSELLDRAAVLVQCLPTAELPQGAAENTLRAIVAILRAHNYSIDVVPKDGALGDDKAVQEAVTKELGVNPNGGDSHSYDEDDSEEPTPVKYAGAFHVGDRVIVNYNREERLAAGFQDHISDDVIDNQPGEIIATPGYNTNLPFKVKLDKPGYFDWWLPVESLKHEGAAEEVVEKEEASVTNPF